MVIRLWSEHVAANKSHVWPTDEANIKPVHFGQAAVARVVYRPTAQDKALLMKLGITHVVNAAHGPHHIDTGPSFYIGTNILYHGVEAPDCKDFDMSSFFTEAADFIYGALSQKGTSPSEAQKAK